MDRQYLLTSTIFVVFSTPFGVLHAKAETETEVNSAPCAVELAMWEYALETGKPSAIDRFPELYSKCLFSEEATRTKTAIRDESTAMTTQSGSSLGIVFSKTLEDDH